MSENGQVRYYRSKLIDMYDPLLLVGRVSEMSVVFLTTSAVSLLGVTDDVSLYSTQTEAAMVFSRKLILQFMI